MTSTSVSLPVLPPDQPLRLTPTDVTSFVRSEQCERFLRFRLADRARQKFMEAYDVAAQAITPLLSLSGRTFEEGVEGKLGTQFRTVHFAALAKFSHNRPNNNAEVVKEARDLGRGATTLLLQVRLDAVLDRCSLRGDADLIRLHRREDGVLEILITDLKSTTAVKVEHRLQVTFYRLMLEKILADADVLHQPIDLGILYRPPAEPDAEDAETSAAQRQKASDLLGLPDAALEVVADPDVYIRSVRDLVLDEASVARRVASTPFEEIPYCLSFKCDGCLYNEFCMKWSAEKEDLSLLPFMNGTDREVLRGSGITTVTSLATLKQPAPASPTTGKGDLVPSPGREEEVRRLAATWPVGPRLDELVHRARAFRRFARKDDIEAFPFIPGKGNSSLPAVRPDLNPNLVWVYLDAQHDYLNDRVYLLSALVVASKDGTPDPARRRAIVSLTDGPPETAARERDLFVAWTRDLVQAVAELAHADGERKAAPIHLVFFDRYEQRLLLEGLARNFPPILKATPPLYDFLTQLAAFDSPIATYLSEEVREAKNYPMVCQSLQSLATYLKFDWNTPLKFRELFRARLFDYLGKLDVAGTTEWYTKRARFGSTVPLEYAYAAWGQLPAPKPGREDDLREFRPVTRDLLAAFQGRRLEAMEHVAKPFPGNPNTQKTPFTLPEIARYEDKARDLAHALDEFVRIERLVSLADWKGTRHAPPEQRALMGECLLVRYCEEDQEPGVAEQNRENERRRQKREEYSAAFRAAHPGKPLRLPKEQVAECKWSPEELRLKLRVETAGVDCDLNELLLLSTLRDGTQVVLLPRWTVDERLPEAARTPFTPTPKQMLYGQRAELVRVVATARDPETGRITAAVAEVELRESHGSAHTTPFVFGAFNRPLADGQLYTLDPCPNEWYAYWCARVVEGLCAGSPNVLYERLVTPPAPGDGQGSPGQKKFLAGLNAFHAAGLLHDFEPGKRDLIGGHARTPILMVQGPPGTGKSYSTAFAVFARIQGAMQAGQDYRVFLSCKTHAATDVLLENVRDVRHRLRELRAADPKLFARHFDARLLEVPLYRVAPRDSVPDGVIPLVKDTEKGKGAKGRNADAIQEHPWAVIAVTPGGTYGMLKKKWENPFGHELCDLLVLDEASQMNLPEALMAALPLRGDAPVLVVGDHRQMPPIVKHDWDAEARRTFREYQAYRSLFDTLRAQEPPPPMIRFAESFRLHGAMAEFLRREIYQHDGIHFHSRKTDLLAARPHDDDFTAAVLHPEYPLVVVVHDEAGSQVRNPFEQDLIGPLLRTLADRTKYGLDADEGLGVVVPHRAQRAAIQQAFPELSVLDPATGLPARSAVDTVERFQGGERTVILVSATESDRGYLLASAGFLLDPRRLTVAVSRAKRKLILVAARSIFSLFSPDEETFANALLWKNLLTRTCSFLLWSGERKGVSVSVWGGR